MLPEKKKSIFIKSEIVIIQIFVLRYEQQRTLLIPSKKKTLKNTILPTKSKLGMKLFQL